MSVATDFAALNEPELLPYRAMSRSAIVSAVMAGVGLPLVVLAVVSMRFQVGDAVPLGMLAALFGACGLVLGIAGLRTIRRYPTEYTGVRLARTGLFGGLALLAMGGGVASFTYATEVPEGYARVGFWELQPDPDDPDQLPIARKAFDIQGEKIFIKGYMHPGVASMGRVNHFILVPDMGTCCFGGQPKPTDMIEVYIPEGKQRIAYAPRRMKLAGTFMLADRPIQSLGLSGVWYHLKADQVQ